MSNPRHLDPGAAFFPGARPPRRRKPTAYKKLLWFKQPFPDNYTDEKTFLDHLQRNPRLQPYEFWALMADATVIVQHLASVALFATAFAAIIQQHISPVVVVGAASCATVGGWVCWDRWGARAAGKRAETVKSAVLIYCALLGLSPILKSLTRSTSSDSIWALSTWLLMMNVAFFDYGSAEGARLPASMSTNSAMMASAVLASRLPSTTHVFSLTLFSIEIFGLFPIFRRELRARSWRGHMALTVLLVVSAWGCVFVTLTGGGRGAFVAGVVLGSAVTFVCMGVCSWWLIGLQKYKNEMHGPWDPARPVIRRRWD